jgi:hypothetical protein
VEVEMFSSNQDGNYLREYIKSHEGDIKRRMDVLVLYIDSYRKIFERNMSEINSNILSHIQILPSAVEARKSYLNEYLYAIKDGFEKAANNIIAISQSNILLEEINLEEYDCDMGDEYSQVSEALIKTAKDISAIGRAFGEPYITSAWTDHKDYKIKKTKYYDIGNAKDRYLIDIHFDDKSGYAQLNITSFFKLGI